jgi:hypothetical protein
MNLAINGKAVFTWTGDKAEVEHIEQTVRSAAARFNLTPDAFAQNAMRHFPKTGLIAEGRERNMQMLLLVYFIFSMDTTHPEHPGKFRDYIAGGRFNFDVRVDAEHDKFTVKMTGVTWNLDELPPEGSA